MKRAILLAMAAVVITAVPAWGTQGEPHKVTLCHRTHSETNPYVEVTVDVASVKFEGHDSHDGPIWYPGAKEDGVFWGDIIPAFSIGDGYPFDYAGKNVPEGQSFLDNACEYVPPTPTPTPTPTETETPTPTPTHSHTPTWTPTWTPTGQPPKGGPGPQPSPTAFTGSNTTLPIAAGAGLLTLGLGSLLWARRRSA